MTELTACYITISEMRSAMQMTGLNLLRLREEVEPLAAQIICPKDNVFSRMISAIDAMKDCLRVAQETNPSDLIRLAERQDAERFKTL